jgi:SAM-dependent methyltransferase
VAAGKSGLVPRSDAITQVIRNHWDRRARTFDEGVGHGLFSEAQRHAWLDLLSRFAARAPARVLDVGCGTGFLSLRFAELGHNVTGIDLSSRMIGLARRKAANGGLRVDFRIGDAAALDFQSGTYDLVVGRHVIWNLPDPERGVAEWLRVLRPGGLLILFEGKWADRDNSTRHETWPGSQVFARAIDAVAPYIIRVGGLRMLLNRRYAQVEAQLPFSGGPSATRLATFLEANSVQSVALEPLMDPTLWGGTPRFPRYLAVGARSPDQN